MLLSARVWELSISLVFSVGTFLMILSYYLVFTDTGRLNNFLLLKKAKRMKSQLPIRTYEKGIAQSAET